MKTKNSYQTLKTKLLTIAAFILTSPLMAQTNDSSTVKDTAATVVEKAIDSSSSSGSAFWDWVVIILIVGGLLFMIAHMTYIIITTKRFAETNHDVEYFKSIREKQGKSLESSEEENDECRELLDQAYQTWTYIVEDEDGYEYRRPNKMKEIIESEKILNQVAEIAPTHEEIINVFNEYKDVVSSNKNRSFDGSKKIVYLGLGVGLLITIITSCSVPDSGFFSIFFTLGLFFIIPVGIYYMASYTPQFLIAKRANRGGGNVSSGLVSMALAVLGSGYTVRYHYNDGSTEDDNSAYGIAFFLGMIAMLIVALTIIIWAVVNYLRNYVLYF